MSDVNSNQMVDEIIKAIDTARENECPHRVRRGVIDSLYWINAYQLIERYKDDLLSTGVLNDYDYVDYCGPDWITEVIMFENMLKHFQWKASKVVNSGVYGMSLETGAVSDGYNPIHSPSGSGDNYIYVPVHSPSSPWGDTNAQIGSGNVDQSANTITQNSGIVFGHRLNDNGVLEVKTADGWVVVK